MTKKKEEIQQPSDAPQPEDVQTEKVGLKPQGIEENTGKKETRWKKVSAVFDEAQKAYMAGSGFGEVVATLIETLKNLAKSEVPQALGGLGINDGPEMDLPAQEPPADDQAAGSAPTDQGGQQ
jgi:hypothetical protein